MKLWHLHFLGVPRAFCGNEQAHLRSKETWAILASLIVPALLRGEIACPAARETLNDRFWGDYEVGDNEENDARDPGAPLRQCLTSLRNVFGKTCLVADRHDIQIERGWFTSDIAAVLIAYRKAQNATSIQERLDYLLQAEEEIRGEFFEGWTPRTNDGQLWLIQLRADIRSRLVAILLLLAETLEETGDLPGAFNVIRRILQFQPGHDVARKSALRLAIVTGQRDVIEALERVPSFREAVDKLTTRGISTVSLRDRRLFQSLFETEFQTLLPQHQRALQRLSVLPAPFHLPLAAAVCRTSSSVLKALARTPFLMQEGEDFFLPAIVRECIWKQLPLSTRQHLRQRLALHCIEVILPSGSDLPVDAMPVSLAPVERGRLVLQAALEWVIEQLPNLQAVYFINALRNLHLDDLTREGIPFLQKIVDDPLHPADLRIDASVNLAYIFMGAGEHINAISPLKTMLPIAEECSDIHWLATLHSTLMMNYSNLGAWEKAKEHACLAQGYYQQERHIHGFAHCIRVRAEIHYYEGDLERALFLCEEALTHRRVNSAFPAFVHGLAETLYWKACILLELRCWEDAAAAVEEALSLWKKDKSIGQATDRYVGQCLCIMGQIHTGQGCFAEARAHLEHAILLHERFGVRLYKIAELDALGDLCVATQQYEEARKLFSECLAFYSEQKRSHYIARLTAKLEALPPVPTDNPV